MKNFIDAFFDTVEGDSQSPIKPYRAIENARAQDQTIKRLKKKSDQTIFDVLFGTAQKGDLGVFSFTDAERARRAQQAKQLARARKAKQLGYKTLTEPGAGSMTIPKLRKGLDEKSITKPKLWKGVLD